MEKSGIQHATRATVGILKETSQPPLEATKATFAVRASGVHIRDGYILTAQHGVKGGTTERPLIAENIRVLTGTLEEFPAHLIGVSAFLDIAVYRIDFDQGETNPCPRSRLDLIRQNPETTSLPWAIPWDGAQPWPLDGLAIPIPSSPIWNRDCIR